jgi:predicted methyltransferase
MVNRPASAVEWARSFVTPALKDGALAVDATAGKGNDTLFLARSVGPAGKVLAFDIQEQALQKTAEKLKMAGVAERVVLLRENHSHMKKFVSAPLDAVMFNLGYLPGSDRAVVTQPANTVEAMITALELLSPGGRMSVVVYTGHPGAAAEARSVAVAASTLDSSFTVLKMTFWNGPLNSPEIYFFARAGDAFEAIPAEKNS